MEVEAADDPLHEDHTAFWLVLADQFLKLGIDSSQIRDRALRIIDRGLDLAILSNLGMTAADLRKRSKVLNELRGRLLEPVSVKPRTTLREPQTYVMDIGDVLFYPTFKGEIINPYLHPPDQEYLETQDGWGAIVVVDRGRAFEFLSWYRPLTIVSSCSERPTLESLRGKLQWRLSSAGTCSSAHFKRVKMEKIGQYSIDEGKLKTKFSAIQPGTYAAIKDISIANEMCTKPAFNGFLDTDRRTPKGIWRYPTVAGIDEIAMIDSAKESETLSIFRRLLGAP